MGHCLACCHSTIQIYIQEKEGALLISQKFLLHVPSHISIPSEFLEIWQNKFLFSLLLATCHNEHRETKCFLSGLWILSKNTKGALENEHRAPEDPFHCTVVVAMVWLWLRGSVSQLLTQADVFILFPHPLHWPFFSWSIWSPPSFK